MQVRSFDAMCYMTAASLGIVPLAACPSQVSNLGLKVVRLNDDRSIRRLVIARRLGTELPATAALLFDHLRRR
ncbi:MAG TPA: hypothetical protein VFR86_00255 [Burkholderiaceae bacterium]|nr:hypothetical protein [Burkholderiaceae bacterium]